jgi:photosystem II stability/assembly factor-like uncharacterized protein
VSGSHGTVGKSTNGGKNWKWFVVKDFDSSDFRDIEAFDAATAVIMAVGSPAYILKTNDGGETWKVVYENKTEGMFLDAMEFWTRESGIVIGDPIKGRFFVATYDKKNDWKDIPFDKRPLADSGEACFAASGTNVRALSESEAIFVSGGAKSRIFTKFGATPVPVIQGQETTGANSIAVYDYLKRKPGKRIFVVGGDFNHPDSKENNAAFTTDGGKSWNKPKTAPNGYRSCVEYLSKKEILACGLSGVDFSGDGGKNFSLISNEGFHVCRMAKESGAVYLAGRNGRVARLE